MVATPLTSIPVRVGAPAIGPASTDVVSFEEPTSNGVPFETLAAIPVLEPAHSTVTSETAPARSTAITAAPTPGSASDSPPSPMPAGREGAPETAATTAGAPDRPGDAELPMAVSDSSVTSETTPGMAVADGQVTEETTPGMAVSDGRVTEETTPGMAVADGRVTEETTPGMAVSDGRVTEETAPAMAVSDGRVTSETAPAIAAPGSPVTAEIEPTAPGPASPVTVETSPAFIASVGKLSMETAPAMAASASQVTGENEPALEASGRTVTVETAPGTPVFGMTEPVETAASLAASVRNAPSLSAIPASSPAPVVNEPAHSPPLAVRLSTGAFAMLQEDEEEDEPRTMIDNDLLAAYRAGGSPVVPEATRPAPGGSPSEERTQSVSAPSSRAPIRGEPERTAPPEPPDVVLKRTVSGRARPASLFPSGAQLGDGEDPPTEIAEKKGPGSAAATRGPPTRGDSPRARMPNAPSARSAPANARRPREESATPGPPPRLSPGLRRALPLVAGGVALAVALFIVARVVFPTELATVDISSMPPGADIIVDGELTQMVTPAKIQMSAKTPHVIELHLPGRLPWSDTLTLPAEAPATVIRADLRQFTERDREP